MKNTVLVAVGGSEKGVVSTVASLLLSVLLAIDQRAGRIQTSPESIARELLANFNSGRFDAASKNFNETMRTTATPTILAELKRQSDADLGGFRSITDVRQRRENGFRVIELVCRYEKSLASFRVVFDVYDHVGAVFLDPIVSVPVDPVLEAGARELLKDFVAGEFEAAAKQFDAKMRAELPPSRLAQLQAQITTKYGAFHSITEIHQITDQTYRIIDLTTAYDRSPVSFRVVFDSAGRVAGVRIAPVVTR